MKETNPTEWEMTEEERRDLEDIATQRQALVFMSEAHYEIALKLAKVECRWWGTIRKRLELDNTKSFYADPISGKIREK